ncbi:DUF883 family protein [Herbaspirillum sp. RTI4]|uniref:DUF883 family protein n=1 Tax=Herbaspirillum sp. RTI4 TaxID=3048640 RepID=UPI002AB5B0EB|nr:DUF883 family protein [Herbaspirillum sp. RTI4]MDY7577921.1 DUF883 family protein [Herbaspirillum sp. RTI4]MEA9981633.1 DUF883 family protein [Herbaspirillum sp. RTI4]
MNKTITTDLSAVRGDVKNLIDDARKLFQDAAESTGKTADDLRAKGQKLLEDAINSAYGIQATTLERSREIATATDGYVHENPWRAIAVSAGFGVLVGLALSRTCSRSS